MPTGGPGAPRITLALGAGMALGIAAMVGALVLDKWPRAGPPGFETGGRRAWTEIKWPFAVHLWSNGRAFRCNLAACQGEVTLFVRAKIGFCNCTTGVADDEELERLTDFHLVGDRLQALGAGKPITVAWMNGRSRAYELSSHNRSGKSALSVAFNDRCDAIVATAVLGHAQPAALEPDVIALLNSTPVMRWAEITLGL